MVENAFRISLDSLFPAPVGKGQDSLAENKFELIFHQETDGAALLNKIQNNSVMLEDHDEEISDKEELFSDDELLKN